MRQVSSRRDGQVVAEEEAERDRCLRLQRAAPRYHAVPCIQPLRAVDQFAQLFAAKQLKRHGFTNQAGNRPEALKPLYDKDFNRKARFPWWSDSDICIPEWRASEQMSESRGPLATTRF